jgi:hypothetical protein
MAHKTCSNCSNQVGVRTLVCPKCQTPFVIKSKKIKRFKPQDVDWRTLEPKDEVKIITGYGPYHDSLDKNGKPVRKYIGCKPGKYLVESVEKEGFFVSDGYHKNFVFMGETRDGVVGIKEAHKIKLVRKHAEEI